MSGTDGRERPCNRVIYRHAAYFRFRNPGDRHYICLQTKLILVQQALCMCFEAKHGIEACDAQLWQKSLCKTFKAFAA